MKALNLALRGLGAMLALIVLMSSPSFAWPESVEITARRGQYAGILKMALYGDFCQRVYIGKIAVRPDPRLGQVSFHEGEENHPELGCKSAKIPFMIVLYKAGPASGDDKFTLYVSDGASLQPINVTVHVR